MVERIDQLISGVFSVSLALAGAALMAWGALIIGAQCFAWLKFGCWQQIPAFAALLTPDAQTHQLVPIALIEAAWSPLFVTPSIGHFESLDDVSGLIAGRFVGVAKLVAEVISWPLSAWMAVLGICGVGIATHLGDN